MIQNIGDNKKDFKINFLSKVKRSYYESGYFSEADDYLIPFIIHNHPFYFDWIYELYRENYQDEYFVSNLLKILAHISYENITPICIKIAEESLMHESSEIKESAVMAFENWEYTDAIPMLEIIHFNDEFLDDYLRRVIEDLKEIKEEKEVNNGTGHY
jgi:hypothetical protein